jgi:hypothetical protein
MPEIPTLRRLRQENLKFKVKLDYIVSLIKAGLPNETLSQKKKKKKKRKKKIEE